MRVTEIKEKDHRDASELANERSPLTVPAVKGARSTAKVSRVAPRVVKEDIQISRVCLLLNESGGEARMPGAVDTTKQNCVILSTVGTITITDARQRPSYPNSYPHMILCYINIIVTIGFWLSKPIMKFLNEFLRPVPKHDVYAPGRLKV